MCNDPKNTVRTSGYLKFIMEKEYMKYVKGL